MGQGCNATEACVNSYQVSCILRVSLRIGVTGPENKPNTISLCFAVATRQTGQQDLKSALVLEFGNKLFISGTALVAWNP